jgi:phosphocarrier protein HPr
MEDIERSVIVGDERGMHGRTSRTIVSIVVRHGAECTLSTGDGSRTANGRSILNVMALGAAFGDRLLLRVNGAAADAAMAELAEYLERGPYLDWLGPPGSSNSDPAIRTMTLKEQDDHRELLNSFGAASIDWEHRYRQLFRSGADVPMPQNQSRAQAWLNARDDLARDQLAEVHAA